MSTRPVISVIISAQGHTYDTVKRAIESALAQSITNLEVIVIVDDNDSLASLLSAARAQFGDEPRISIVTLKLEDGTDAASLGIPGTGTYVSFLNPDGAFPARNVLQALVDALQQSGLSVVAGNYSNTTAALEDRGPHTGVAAHDRLQGSFARDERLTFHDVQVSDEISRYLFTRTLLEESKLGVPSVGGFRESLFLTRALMVAHDYVALERNAYCRYRGPASQWSAEETFDELESIVASLDIAAEHRYQQLADHVLERFRAIEVQYTIQMALAHNPERTTALLDRIGQIALKQRRVSTAAENPEAEIDVSVIVPVYNSAAWLHECLLSVLRQSEVSTQIICVNDGSTDDSLHILHGYRALHPDRVQVIDQTNEGLSVARNTGLRAATGRYVCMLDSDDYWRMDALKSLVDRADTEQLDVLQFDAAPFRDGDIDEKVWDRYSAYYARPNQPKTVLAGVELLAKQRESSAYQPNAALYLTRRSYLVDLGLQFIPGIMHEDNPFTFAIMLNAGRAAHEAIELHARRIRPDSIMNSSSVERSMRGYFVSYLHMRNEAARHSYDGDLSRVLGLTLYGIFNNVSTRLEQVDDAAAERLADLISTPDAQQTYSTLMRLRNQSLKLAELARSNRASLK